MVTDKVNDVVSVMAWLVAGHRGKRRAKKIGMRNFFIVALIVKVYSKKYRAHSFRDHFTCGSR
jgi:hypothetical protein